MDAWWSNALGGEELCGLRPAAQVTHSGGQRPSEATSPKTSSLPGPNYLVWSYLLKIKVGFFSSGIGVCSVLLRDVQGLHG